MTDPQFRYNLRLSISIEKQEGRPSGGPDNGIWWQQTQERLSVDQTLNLGAMSFLDVTRVLAQLHDLVGQLPHGEETRL